MQVWSGYVCKQCHGTLLCFCKMSGLVYSHCSSSCVGVFFFFKRLGLTGKVRGWCVGFTECVWLTCTRRCVGRRGAGEVSGPPSAGRGFLRSSRSLSPGNPPRGRGNSWWCSSGAGAASGLQLTDGTSERRGERRGTEGRPGGRGGWVWTAAEEGGVGKTFLGWFPAVWVTVLPLSLLLPHWKTPYSPWPLKDRLHTPTPHLAQSEHTHTHT